MTTLRKSMLLLVLPLLTERRQVTTLYTEVRKIRRDSNLTPTHVGVRELFSHARKVPNQHQCRFSPESSPYPPTPFPRNRGGSYAQEF